MYITALPEQRRLELCFVGHLYVRLVHPVWNFCQNIPKGIDACLLDLRAVDYIFDSGLALLLLYRRLNAQGAWISICRGDVDILRRWPGLGTLVAWNEAPLVYGEGARNELRTAP